SRHRTLTLTLTKTITITPNSSLCLTESSKLNLTATNQTCVDNGSLQSLLAVFYTVIFTLGLVGNLLALWVFFYIDSKKNSVRVFLINVAFADLLLVVCLPFRILYHSRGNVWTMGPTLCKVVGSLFYMNMYISVALLGLISVDRYMKIHRGARGAAQTAVHKVEHRALFLLRIDRNNSNQVASKLLQCFHYKQLHDAKWKAYINISVLVFFWLVFVSLMVSYGKIALKLLRTSQEKPNLPNASRYARTSRKSFFILFLFIVCFVPYHMVRVFYIITQITDTSCFWQDVANKANEVALLLSALNSCLDPVMFFLLSSSVRKEVLRLVGNVFCAQDLAGGSGSSSTAEQDGKTSRMDRGQANKVPLSSTCTCISHCHYGVQCRN
uniref:Probable G-protein coupled receptor 34 n=1 Tax=Sander lucioperca TaxID=283035 RepID=A0A8C9WY43_SANLU